MQTIGKTIRPVRKQIEHVEFSLQSTQDIVAESVLEIVVDGVWSGGKPVPGGLLDPILGAITPAIPCATCGGQMISKAVQMHLSETAQEPMCFECPGHFGHLPLPLPFFTRATIETAFQLLSIFCVFCGECLVTEKKLPNLRQDTKNAANDIDRLRILYNSLKGTPFCREHCHRTQPLFSMARGKFRDTTLGSGTWFPITATFPAEDSKEAEASPADILGKTFPVTALRAEHALFLAKADYLATTFNMFGRNVEKARHYIKCMVLRAIPVPPPCIRPTEINGSGTASKANLHSMTQKFLHIVRSSRSLRAAISMCDAPTRINSFTEMSFGIRRMYDSYAAVQFYIDWLHDAKHAGPPPISIPKVLFQAPQTSGYSISSCFNSKIGRIRYNIMGKRVNFSGRTVISPDPNVPFDYVALPREMTECLTIPERVTPLNRCELEKEASVLVSSHGSTRSLFSASGESSRDLTLQPYDSLRHGRLAVGQIVERRLRDGDIVLLNRQPTLHGPSIQAVRVMIQDRKSIAFGLSKTTPFNADFDGDEMNIHVPQTMQARVEAEQLMMTAQQLLLPAKGAPCMGMNQDGLLSMWLMSRRDEFFTRADALQMLFHAMGDGIRGSDTLVNMALPMPAIFRPRELWTGKQIISAALPEALNLVKGPERQEDEGTDLYPADSAVIVIRGQILAGQLSKRTVGVSGGTIQHAIATSPSYAGNEPERLRAISSFFDAIERIGREFMTNHGFRLRTRHAHARILRGANAPIGRFAPILLSSFIVCFIGYFQLTPTEPPTLAKGAKPPQPGGVGERSASTVSAYQMLACCAIERRLAWAHAGSGNCQSKKCVCVVRKMWKMRQKRSRW